MFGMCLGANAQKIINLEGVNDPNFVNKDGKVGIGTTNPKARLQINEIRPILFNNNGSSGVYGSEIGFNSKLNTTVIPNKFIKLGSTEQKGAAIQVVDHHGNMFFQMYDSNTLDERIIDYKPQVTFTNTGNLGIGTTTPSTRLEINNGTLKVSGGSALGQESARFIVDSGSSYGHSLMELRNINGVMLKVLGNGNAALNGKFESKEIKVTNTPTADFVFDKDYNLPTLKSIEKHIKEKKHLPEIASAREMEKNGVNIGSFQIQLLQKIEELTLYTIKQNKELKKQNSKIDKLENEVLKSLLERVSKLEKEIKNKN